MADEMRRRSREDARGRAGVTRSGIKAGRDLGTALGADYTKMRTKSRGRQVNPLARLRFWTTYNAS